LESATLLSVRLFQPVFANANDPTGLVVDSSGNLYEADLQSDQIYKFTPAGVKSTFASGLNAPEFLAFAPVPEPSSLAFAVSGL
jgi:hypothetical protein